MSRHVDLVVIGSGSAATTAAFACRSAGWSVAIVDRRPFGGTCANRGCDPKKVLVGLADLVDAARRLNGKGVTGDLPLSWEDLMRFKRTFTDPVPKSREDQFSDAGIQAFHGTARFLSEERVEVDGATFTASKILIAAGAEPVPLAIEGQHLLQTSDDFLELSHLPESVLFVGGGYIGFEFAHLAARAGARVTILNRGKRALAQFDQGMTDQLVAHTRRIGIDVQFESPVDRITGSAGDVTVHSNGGRSFHADMAFHAAGRVPPLERMHLDAGNVRYSERGVAVNEFLQSVSNPRVYSAGDAADSGGLPLTPVAGYEGRIVSRNLLHGNCETARYDGCASVVFTIPPLAAAGLTEEAAVARGLAFDVETGDTTGWYSSRRLAEECSGYKVLVERETARVLGAHILGHGADELINLFALGIRQGLTAQQMKEPLYAYPTHGSNLQYLL